MGSQAARSIWWGGRGSKETTALPLSPATMPRGKTRAQDCCNLAGFRLQLAPPRFNHAWVSELPTPRYIQLSPSFFCRFSLTESELIASLVTFPKMVPRGISPLDFLSPLVWKEVIEDSYQKTPGFLINCWQQEGSITWSITWGSEGYKSSLCWVPGNGQIV